MRAPAARWTSYSAVRLSMQAVPRSETANYRPSEQWPRATRNGRWVWLADQLGQGAFDLAPQRAPLAFQRRHRRLGPAQIGGAGVALERRADGRQPHRAG